MNELKEQINIETMIYEIREKQVLLDSEIFATKCHKEIKKKVSD